MLDDNVVIFRQSVQTAPKTHGPVVVSNTSKASGQTNSKRIERMSVGREWMDVVSGANGVSETSMPRSGNVEGGMPGEECVRGAPLVLYGTEPAYKLDTISHGTCTVPFVPSMETGTRTSDRFLDTSKVGHSTNPLLCEIRRLSS